MKLINKKLTKKEVIDKLVPERYCMKNNNILCSWGGFSINTKNIHNLVCAYTYESFSKLKIIKKSVNETSKIKAPKWCPLK
jgi:hypothetical protein|tara:strand:+ start:433 stop:675 length:243 start_codon:yes stop_codon:yes gene_type:complete